MLHQLFAHSPDLRELRNEGYDLEIRSNHLLVKDVPYVNSRKEVKRGILVMPITLAGNATTRPSDHVAHFSGDYPCKADGTTLEHIRNVSGERMLAPGVTIQHTFSAKPMPKGNYDDYYDKVTTYVRILSGPAWSIDPAVTAKTFAPIQPDGANDDPFNYIDTASSRAEIGMVTQKVNGHKIAIIGLGGTPGPTFWISQQKRPLPKSTFMTATFSFSITLFVRRALQRSTLFARNYRRQPISRISTATCAAALLIIRCTSMPIMSESCAPWTLYSLPWTAARPRS